MVSYPVNGMVETGSGMGRSGGAKTRARIEQAARLRVLQHGLQAFTLDLVAADVGLTKQAVLYHYGSRAGLLAAVYLAELAAESEALAAPTERAEPGLPAVRAFLQAALDYYLADPTRFRLLYAAMQTGQIDLGSESGAVADIVQTRIYPLTRRIYDALESRLQDAPGLAGVDDARRLGVSLHMAAIGIACYAAMLDACDERFAHDWHEVAQTLAGALTAAVSGRRSRASRTLRRSDSKPEDF